MGLGCIGASRISRTVEFSRRCRDPAWRAILPRMKREITVCLSFDFDAMSVWITNFRTESPNALSRGEFGKVGAGRILDLLADRGLPATWFIPGHTIEAFPEVCARIAEAGPEPDELENARQRHRAGLTRALGRSSARAGAFAELLLHPGAGLDWYPRVRAAVEELR